MDADRRHKEICWNVGIDCTRKFPYTLAIASHSQLGGLHGAGVIVWMLHVVQV